jgi:RND family efflux transporter MFP subunit
MSTKPFAIGLLAAALVASGCGFQGETRHREVDRYPRIETVEPTLHTMLPVSIELSATVEALEKADLCARVPGLVEDVPSDIDIGRQVTAGEKLIRLAVPDLEAEKAYKEALWEEAKKKKAQALEAQRVAGLELEEAKKLEKRYQAEYTYRKLEHERVAELAQRDTVTKQRRDETQNQMEAALAAWEAAKAQIDTKRGKLDASAVDVEAAESRIKVAAAEVNRLDVLLRYATITAPFDGVITKLWVSRGAMIKDPSVPLLTVMRTDVVRVLMDVPERDVPLIRVAVADKKPNLVELHVPALRETVGNKAFIGHVTRMAAALDPNTRTMRTEVHLENKDGVLRPGMYGTATITLETRENVLTVPSTAVVVRGKQVELFCVVDHPDDPMLGIVQRAPVQIGLDDGMQVQVRGLTGKERIIAKGSGVVREGDTVIAVPLRP